MYQLHGNAALHAYHPQAQQTHTYIHIDRQTDRCNETYFVLCDIAKWRRQTWQLNEPNKVSDWWFITLALACHCHITYQSISQSTNQPTCHWKHATTVDSMHSLSVVWHSEPVLFSLVGLVWPGLARLAHIFYHWPKWLDRSKTGPTVEPDRFGMPTSCTFHICVNGIRTRCARYNHYFSYLVRLCVNDVIFWFVQFLYLSVVLRMVQVVGVFSNATAQYCTSYISVSFHVSSFCMTNTGFTLKDAEICQVLKCSALSVNMVVNEIL